MPSQVIYLPLDRSSQLGDPEFPRTRAEALAIAEGVARTDCREIHIVAVVEADELCEFIELARVEMSRAGESWRLRYVSHPSQSIGLTGLISPSEDDLAWRMVGIEAPHWTPVVEVCASDEMHAEGLHPCARLDLRALNAFPVVPTVADLVRLRRRVVSGCLPR